MRNSLSISILAAAALAWAGCATDVRPNEADAGGGNNPDVVVVDNPPAVDVVTPMDVMVGACNAELNAPRSCACLGLGQVGVQTCIGGNWSMCQCPDAGSPPADMPVTPTDNPITCTNTCRSGFAPRPSDCLCVSRCALNGDPCGSNEVCEADTRTGEWGCRVIDAGTPDSGPPCVVGEDCTSLCPTNHTGRRVCGSNPGCACTQNPPPDAGMPDIGVDAGPTCVIGQTRCTDGCFNLQEDNLHCGSCVTACAAGTRCSAARCVLDCAAGSTECPGVTVCVNTSNTVAHCGRCGNACAPKSNATVTCASGGCVYACAPNFIDVNGDLANAVSNGCEIDTRTNPSHCGSQNNACRMTVSNGTGGCVDGRCVVGCTMGFLNLDGVAANGCEIDTNTDRNNCGRQGNVCSAGTDCCGGRCVDPQTERAHCGACGRACTGSDVCVLGSCTGICPVSWPQCGGSCTDPNSSVLHCGRCGNACPSFTNASPVCRAGSCAMGSCAFGYDNCNGNTADGCEINLYADPRNCGRCGNACPSGANSVATCSYFTGCGLRCAAGFDDCDRDPSNGCEVNVNTSNAHCGACGWSCPSGQSCNGAGRCVPTCTSPALACDGRCVDPRTDPNHCGGCYNSCNPALNMSASCRASTCVFACTTGFADCDSVIGGCETSVTTTTNCGACGNRCATGQSCVAGACACATGQTLCGGACTNTLTDMNNCGACGRVCATGQTCSAGACSGTTPVDAGTPDVGTPDSGTPDAGMPDAGTPDVGTPDSGVTDVPDSGIMPITCPAGTRPRRITFRLPTAIPAICNENGYLRAARPIFWARATTDRVRIGRESDVTTENLTGVPTFTVPFPTVGPATSLPMRFTNTAAWPTGVTFYMSARCNNTPQTHYEADDYWGQHATLDQFAGASFLVDGIERAAFVRYHSASMVLAYVMEYDPCIAE